MKSSRLPFPPIESYWASNVADGAKKGTSSLTWSIIRGVGGVVYDPYIGYKQGGVRSGGIGFVKGVGGLVARPIKGCFDFVAQPMAGLAFTPGYIYKKITTKKDPSTAKETNFKMFGIEEDQFNQTSVTHDPVTNEKKTFLLYDRDSQFLDQKCIEEKEPLADHIAYDINLQYQSRDINQYVSSQSIHESDFQDF